MFKEVYCTPFEKKNMARGLSRPMPMPRLIEGARDEQSNVHTNLGNMFTLRYMSDRGCDN